MATDPSNEYENPFEPNIAPGLSLIMLMRIYDVAMALLTDKDKAAAARLYQIHAGGGIVGPLPAFTNEGTDEQDTDIP